MATMIPITVRVTPFADEDDAWDAELIPAPLRLDRGLAHLDRLARRGTIVEPRPIRRQYGRSLLGWIGVGIVAAGAVAWATLAFGATMVCPSDKPCVTDIAPGPNVWAVPAVKLSSGICLFQNKRGGLVTFPQREDGSCNIEDARP